MERKTFNSVAEKRLEIRKQWDGNGGFLVSVSFPQEDPIQAIMAPDVAQPLITFQNQLFICFVSWACPFSGMRKPHRLALLKISIVMNYQQIIIWRILQLIILLVMIKIGFNV